MAAALSIVLALSNIYPEPPPVVTEASLAECVHQCFYSQSCATFFYDFTLRLCAPSDLLCSIESQSMTIRNNTHCFEWKHIACSEAWSYYRPTNRCLKLQDTEDTFPNSNVTCAMLGAQIVVIKNMRQNNIVRAIAMSGGSDLWIGLKKQSGVRTWLDGTLLGNDFSFWNETQPKEGSGFCHQAMALNGKWRTKRCSPNFSCICEKILTNNDENC